MTQLAEMETHLSNFTRLEKSAQPAWLEALRQAGIERFEKLGFPTTRDEEWRFTNIAPIARTPFKLAKAVDGAAALKAFTFGREAAVELVFINGHFNAELSRLGKESHGVTIGNLSDSLEVAQPYLGRFVDLMTDPFVALNTGFLRDGALVHLSSGTNLRGAIHLLFISIPMSEPTVSHPRVLIVAEENVQAQVVESYVGFGAGVYFTNAVTEIVAGENSRIDHCKLQQETLEAFHISSTRMELGREANVISHSASIGAKLSRNDVTVFLNGQAADATLNGLAILGKQQHCDNHTLLRHEKPNCPSHELFKYVLSDQSTGVFKGKIFVQKDAQQTNAKQTSKSLLLSDEATMNSMPALEIYADDVKCTHGSTIGPVDEEMVFYLRSRGVSLEAARHLLSYAFAADITRRIKVVPVRMRLEDYMAAQHGLPQDLRITDLGGHDEAAR